MATVTGNQIETILQIMDERKSVRKYHSNREIPRDVLNNILLYAGKAPSAWNLQHWKFLVVEKQENKEKLLPIAYHQQQVVDCSAVVIVLGDKEADQNGEKVYGELVRNGLMSEEIKERLVGQIKQAYQSVENIGEHEGIRNASFAAMQLMLAAKAYGIDSCPMGGFHADQLRKELNIPDRYVPVLMITLGYGKEAPHHSFRFPLEDVVVRERF